MRRRRRRGRGRNKTTPLKNTRQRTASTPYINNINWRERERQMGRYLQTEKREMKGQRGTPATWGGGGRMGG